MPDTPLSLALIEPRLFFGGLTYNVNITHEWGSLFCKDCGAWCSDVKGRDRCTGSRWAWDQWRSAITEGIVV